MRVPLRDIQGRVLQHIDVRDDVFNVPMKNAVVHQVVVGQLANKRQGTAKVKTRSQVSGGGAKPRPQKGTGRARQGSIRSPQWRGGGVVFGPTPRSYRQRTPKRVKRSTIRMMLSDKARENQLIILDSLELEAPKTREMIKVMSALDVDSSALLVADGANPEILRAARNVPRLKMLPAALLNTLDILNHRKLVMTLDAVRKAESLWGGKFIRRGGSVAVEDDLDESAANLAEQDADSSDAVATIEDAPEQEATAEIEEEQPADETEPIAEVEDDDAASETDEKE